MLSVIATAIFSLSSFGFAEPYYVDRVKLPSYSINPVVQQYIEQALEKSAADGVPLLIEMDTPGGLLQSTREIVKAILTSKVPVIVYVAPNGSRAASAGVFITMAAHVAAMAPASNIGAAHPVSAGGDWPKIPDSMKEGLTSSPLDLTNQPGVAKDVMSDKVMNDTLAWIQGIAELRGRNAQWARSAVEKSESLIATRALELHVIDLISTTTEDLMAQVDGRVVELNNGTTTTLRTANAVINDIPMTQTQRWLNVLVNPSLAYILFLFGIGMLFYEVTHFGLLLPGIIGIISLLVAGFAFQLLPINYFSLVLLIAGLSLILAEIKLTSYGLLTLAGAACLWYGTVGLYETAPGFPGLAKGLVAGVTFTITAMMLFLVFILIRALRSKIKAGVEAISGKTAVVVTALDPTGKVEFDGTLWNAECDAGCRVEVGEKVSIKKIDGLKMFVQKVKNETKTDK